MVIATTSNGIYKIEGGKEELVEQGRGVYYGLTKTHDGFIVASRNGDRSTLLIYYGPDLRIIKEWELRDHECAGVHEIEFVNRKIYVTDTHRNRIVSLDIDTEDIRCAGWLGDHKHCNTILFHNDRFFIIGLEENEISQIKFDGESICRQKGMGSGLHSFRYINGAYWTCESNSGTVLKLGLNENNLLGRLGKFHVERWDYWHTRGIANEDGEFYIGLSPRAERSSRHGMTPKIKLFDEKWFAAGEFEFPNMGQLLDLLTI